MSAKSVKADPTLEFMGRIPLAILKGVPIEEIEDEARRVSGADLPAVLTIIRKMAARMKNEQSDETGDPVSKAP